MKVGACWGRRTGTAGLRALRASSALRGRSFRSAPRLLGPTGLLGTLALRPLAALPRRPKPNVRGRQARRPYSGWGAANGFPSPG